MTFQRPYSVLVGDPPWWLWCHICTESAPLCDSGWMPGRGIPRSCLPVKKASSRKGLASSHLILRKGGPPGWKQTLPTRFVGMSKVTGTPKHTLIRRSASYLMGTWGEVTTHEAECKMRNPHLNLPCSPATTWWQDGELRLMAWTKTAVQRTAFG